MNKLLKLLLALPLVLLCCTITACGDDDDNNKDIDSGNELIGKWVDATYDTWEFKSNGQLIITEVYSGQIYTTSNNKYSVNGSTLRIDWNIEDGKAEAYSEGEYFIKGNGLTFFYTWHDNTGYDPDDSGTIILTRK